MVKRSTSVRWNDAAAYFMPTSSWPGEYLPTIIRSASMRSPSPSPRLTVPRNSTLSYSVVKPRGTTRVAPTTQSVAPGQASRQPSLWPSGAQCM